jgi:hypothetical protein
VNNSKGHTAFGSISGETGDVVSVVCREGYAGSGSLTCQPNGSFTSNVVCAPNSCQATSVAHSIDHAAVGSISGETGDVVSVVCLKNYYGSGDATCKPNGEFVTVNCISMGTAKMVGSAAIGDTEIAVAFNSNSSGFAVGDQVVIARGLSTEETNVVVGFGSILLRDSLRFDHPIGTLVEADGTAPTSQTNNAAGIGAGDDGKSELSDGALAAIVVAALIAIACVGFLLKRKEKCKIEPDDEKPRSTITISVGPAHQTKVESLGANFEGPSHVEIQQPSLFDPKDADGTGALREVISGFEEEAPDLTANPAFAELTAGGTAFEESAALGKGAALEVEGVPPPPYTSVVTPGKGDGENA